ncbi:hypothetical protein OIU74_016131 [Salix koriyanagi]|uniref:Uncharacterized protein n=1 Tax=Salix koriyanagi TaxID=2511006 RepID=A0A9Q0PFR8_9ROSI|nr:hypothetical protein OIU74_016131 [Salix koriyanagi]
MTKSTHKGTSKKHIYLLSNTRWKRSKNERKRKRNEEGTVMILIGYRMKMEKIVGLGEVVHEGENAGMVGTGLIDSLGLQLTQLGAEPLLRLLRHSEPLPCPL